MIQGLIISMKRLLRQEFKPKQHTDKFIIINRQNAILGTNNLLPVEKKNFYSFNFLRVLLGANQVETKWDLQLRAL